MTSSDIESHSICSDEDELCGSVVQASNANEVAERMKIQSKQQIMLGRRRLSRAPRRDSSAMFRSFVLNGLNLTTLDDEEDEIDFDGSFHQSIGMNASEVFNLELEPEDEDAPSLPSRDICTSQGSSEAVTDRDSDHQPDSINDSPGSKANVRTEYNRSHNVITGSVRNRFGYSLELRNRSGKRLRDCVQDVAINPDNVSIGFCRSRFDESASNIMDVESLEDVDDSFFGTISDREMGYENAKLTSNPLRGPRTAGCNGTTDSEDSNLPSATAAAPVASSGKGAKRPKDNAAVVISAMQRIRKANALILQQKKRKEDSQERQRLLDLFDVSSHHSSSSHSARHVLLNRSDHEIATHVNRFIDSSRIEEHLKLDSKLSEDRKAKEVSVFMATEDKMLVRKEGKEDYHAKDLEIKLLAEKESRNETQVQLMANVNQIEEDKILRSVSLHCELCAERDTKQDAEDEGAAPVGELEALNSKKAGQEQSEDMLHLQEHRKRSTRQECQLEKGLIIAMDCMNEVSIPDSQAVSHLEQQQKEAMNANEYARIQSSRVIKDLKEQLKKEQARLKLIEEKHSQDVILLVNAVVYEKRARDALDKDTASVIKILQEENREQKERLLQVQLKLQEEAAKVPEKQKAVSEEARLNDQLLKLQNWMFNLQREVEAIQKAMRSEKEKTRKLEEMLALLSSNFEEQLQAKDPRKRADKALETLNCPHNSEQEAGLLSETVVSEISQKLMEETHARKNARTQATVETNAPQKVLKKQQMQLDQIEAELKAATVSKEAVKRSAVLDFRAESNTEKELRRLAETNSNLTRDFGIREDAMLEIRKATKQLRKESRAVKSDRLSSKTTALTIDLEREKSKAVQLQRQLIPQQEATKISQSFADKEFQTLKRGIENAPNVDIKISIESGILSPLKIPKLKSSQRSSIELTETNNSRVSFPLNPTRKSAQIPTRFGLQESVVSTHIDVDRDSQSVYLTDTAEKMQRHKRMPSTRQGLLRLLWITGLLFGVVGLLYGYSKGIKSWFVRETYSERLIELQGQVKESEMLVMNEASEKFLAFAAQRDQEKNFQCRIKNSKRKNLEIDRFEQKERAAMEETWQETLEERMENPLEERNNSQVAIEEAHGILTPYRDDAVKFAKEIHHETAECTKRESEFQIGLEKMSTDIRTLAEYKNCQKEWRREVQPRMTARLLKSRFALRSLVLHVQRASYAAAKVVGAEIKQFAGATDHLFQLACGFTASVANSSLLVAQKANYVAGNLASTHAKILDSSRTLAGSHESFIHMVKAGADKLTRANEVANELALQHAKIYSSSLKLGNHQSLAHIMETIKTFVQNWGR